MEFLLQRPTVITLAVIGGILSMIAPWIAAKSSTPELTAKKITKVAYVFMGASMVLFIIAGLRS